MKDLSNHLLKETYEKAVQLRLADDFVKMLEDELARRDIQPAVLTEAKAEGT